jgi:hypothetical protein
MAVSGEVLEGCGVCTRKWMGREGRGRAVEAVYCGVQKHADARSGAPRRGDHGLVRAVESSPCPETMSSIFSMQS